MARDLPSFRSLRALEAVVRQGNVVRAAEDLGVTPGALSKQLAQLAQVLDISLFEPGHRLVPTEAAKDLASAVGAAIGLLRRACDDATTARGRGVLTVTANSSLAMHWLVPRVLAAQTAIGDRPIRIHAVHTTDDWRQFPFDLAIRRGGSVPPGFTGRTLGREQLTLLATPSRAATLAAGGLALLERETMLAARTRAGEMEAWCMAARVPPPRTLRPLPHFYLAIEAALADRGVIVGPTWLATDVHHGKLIMPFPEVLALATPLVGIYDQTSGDGPTLRLFLDWMTAEMNLVPTDFPIASE